MTTAGRLTVEIGANTRNFEQGVHRASQRLREMETTSTRLSRHIGRMGNEFAKVARQATMLGTAAATAAVTGIALLTRNAMQSIDEQAKLARSLDGSIDAVRGLQMAAGDAGVSTGSLTSSIQMLNRRLGEAERAGGPAAEALRRLGLDARRLGEMDVDERMAVIADRIEAMGLSAAQTGDLLRQLGVRNADMVNFMRQGGDAIRAAREEVVALGLSMSEVDAAKIEAANDAVSRLGLFAESAGNGFAVAFSPAVQAAAEAVTDLAREYGGLNRIAEDAGKAMVEAALDSIEWIQRANLVVAEWSLTWLEVQGTVASLQNRLAEFFGKELPGYRGLLGAIAAQREYVESLQEMGSVAQAVRDRIANVSNEPLRLTIGGGLDGGGGDSPVAAVVKAMDAVADREREMLANRLERIRQSLLDEGELRQERLDENLAAVQAGLEQGLLSEAEHLEQRNALLDQFAEDQAERRFRELEAEYRVQAERERLAADTERRIQAMRMQTLQMSVGMLDSLVGQSKKGALAVLALNKGLQIAQTVQNTATAVMRAYADLGPIAGSAAAGKIKALGAAQVGIIAATGLAQARNSAARTEGGGGSGNRGAVASPAEAAPAQSQVVQTFRLEGLGDEQLVEMLNAASRRGLVPTFAV